MVGQVIVEEMRQAAAGPCFGDDLLCVMGESPDLARVVFVQYVTANQWSLNTWSTKPIEPDIAWTRTDAKADQEAALRDAYEGFIRWIGPDTMLESRPRSGSLVVKVDPQSRWVLRFPLSSFHQLGYEAFARYRDVEWITSDKSFSVHGRERTQIRQELRDIETLLTRTVVVLNTYKEYSRDPKCATGTEAMLTILRLLREVQLGRGDRRLSLRWYLNPSVEKVREILLDPSTAYLFADFEASTGVWESGEGMAAAWDRTQPDLATRSPIALNLAPESLRHMRLMRVFHCNSIFDPFSGHPPASERTLVGQLLRAGVWRVEGGMTKELYTQYLKALAMLLLEDDGLKFLVRCQALRFGIDLDSHIERLTSAIS
jgi:hypothetical protein